MKNDSSPEKIPDHLEGHFDIGMPIPAIPLLAVWQDGRAVDRQGRILFDSGFRSVNANKPSPGGQGMIRPRVCGSAASAASCSIAEPATCIFQPAIQRETAGLTQAVLFHDAGFQLENYENQNHRSADCRD